MNNITPATVPEWDTLIKATIDTNLQVRETKQLTHALREEQHKEFSEMKKQRYEEHERAKRETDKIRDEVIRMLKESAKRHEELDIQIKETSMLIKETGMQIKETGMQIKETGMQMKETDKKIKELSTRFSSTTGNMIEGLMSSSATEMFQKAGYDIHSMTKNLVRKSKALNESMEVDVLLYNDTSAIAIEVKANCRKNDIDRFIQQMEKFKRLFPEYKDKEVMLAIAAINFENGVDNYAHERGLIVVRTNSDDFFSIDPCNRETLVKF